MSLEVDLYGVIQNPFYIHGTIPSRDYIKRKNKTGKNFFTEEKHSGLSRKKVLFTKVVSFHTKGFEPESYNRKLLSVYMLSIVK